jgi:isocitrate dehydrogenase kinase/phosphatase
MIGRADVKPHFIEVHKDLFDPDHWITFQNKIKAGEFLHAFPYPKNIRFRPEEEL